MDALGAALPVLPALGTVKHGADLIQSATKALKSKAIFVGTKAGKVVPIPKGFKAFEARSGKGIVFQKPGSTGNANMVRIMDPNDRYPKGYIVYYGPKGNPLDRYGVGGKPRSAWHHGLGEDDPPLGYIDWFKRLNNR